MIRTIARYLLFFVLVVLVTAAGYATVAAARAEPIPTAPDLPVLQPPTQITAVPQLPPVGPDVGTENASTRPPVFPRPLGRAVIQLDGDWASLALGVGVLDGESGALLGWHAVSSDDTASRLIFDEVPEGEHWVVLASEPRTVRMHYLVRESLVMAWEDGELAGSCALSSAVQTVVVDLQWRGDDSSLPPIVSPVLRRLDDLQWRPVPGSLAVDEDRRSMVIGPLGAGRYSLSLDGVAVGEDTPIAQFDVPTTERVTLPCRSR